MAVPELPAWPPRGNREAFRPAAEIFNNALGPWGRSIEATRIEVEANKVIAVDKATEATTQAALSVDQVALSKVEVALSKAEVVNCQDEVLFAKAEVVNCQDEVLFAKAEVVNCQDEVQNAKRYVDNLLIGAVFSSSTTSLSITVSAKTLTTDVDKSYVEGMWVILISKTDPLTWLSGYVTAYDSATGVLGLSVVNVSGIGTYSDWLITQTNPTTLSAGGVSAVSMFLIDSM